MDWSGLKIGAWFLCGSGSSARAQQGEELTLLLLPLHVRVPLEDCAVADNEIGSRDVSKDGPWRLNLDLLLGCNVPCDFSPDEDRRGSDLGFNESVLSNNEMTVDMDIPADISFDGRGSFEGEFSRDLGAFANVAPGRRGVYAQCSFGFGYEISPSANR